MASLTIRNLDNNLKTQLRLRAAQHGCSMEAEVRNILAQSLLYGGESSTFAERLHNRFAAMGCETIAVPSRQPMRTPPDFSE